MDRFETLQDRDLNLDELAARQGIYIISAQSVARFKAQLRRPGRRSGASVEAGRRPLLDPIPAA